MKKFLSLVLALVMTMSLVTISAGAAEYKDLTDKDEIQYEEAVAVLNRLGIITGYTDGSFQPKKELTRGAAAKIIVSLLIGTEAANNLVATAAPYSDVPVDNTFAGVIGFCKTSKIINGYQDGTFRPLGTLSGYAFSKMLLGALGYKGELEGFTGAGWNMKVAALGNEAGLFDRLSFKGNETVNREQACQLALNTLKATLVEYSGGMNVTNGNQTVVVNPNRSYKTSNQDFATNINAKTAANSSEYYTVEFGEEHFVDLRLEHDKKNPTPNDLGQPSAEWSYKKVTIGTYALEPDFRYTELVAHNDKSSTDASKVRALKLNGYEVDGSTQVWLNGYESNIDLDNKVANIANYTDNGTVVEVYVSETDADLITDVVVIQSALVEVKRIGSDYVTLGKYDTDGADDNQAKEGFNRNAFDLVSDGGLAASKSFNDVQVEDRGYGVLSGLKAGDKVVVVPVAEDHGNARFDVWEAYVPETVTGALTRVDTYGSSSSNRGTIGLTVGGTAYKAAEWSKDIIDIDGEQVKVTRKDVTLTLDKYGNALLAEDVGKTEEYMIVGHYYESLIDGRLVDFVHGWDMNGNEIDLNLGRGGKVDRMKPGDLVRYSNSTSGSAEWKLEDGQSTGNKAKIYAVDHNANAGNYQITAYNTKVALIETADHINNTDVGNLATTTTIDFASGVKFIYVEFNDDDEVESIEIRKGVQAASNTELKACHDETTPITGAVYASDDWNSAEAYVGGKASDGTKGDTRAVKAVVIKRESNTAVSSNLLYIRDYLGSAQKTDNSNKIIYGYTVVMNTSDGLAGEAKTIYSYENLDVGSFASYAEVQNDQVSDFYKLREHKNHIEKTTTSFIAEVYSILPSNDNILILDPNYYLEPEDRDTSIGGITSGTPGTAGAGRHDLPAVSTIDYDGDEDKLIGELVDRVRVSGKTQWVDLTGNHIASTKDMKDFVLGDHDHPLRVAMVVNDNIESDGFRDVAMIIIEDATRVGAGPVLPPPSAEGTVNVTINGTSTGYVTVPNGDSTKIISSTGSFTAPRGTAIAIPLNVANGDDVVTVTASAGASATKVGNQILVTPAATGDTTLTITIDRYVAPVALTVSNTDAAWENLTITADGTAITSGDDVTPGATVTISLTQVTGTDLAVDDITSLVGESGIPAGATYSNTAGVTASAAGYEEVTKPTITTASGSAPSDVEKAALKALAVSADGKLYGDNDGTDTEFNPDACTDVDDIPANLYIKWAAGEKTPAEKATLTITFEMPATATTIAITDVD